MNINFDISKMNNYTPMSDEEIDEYIQYLLTQKYTQHDIKEIISTINVKVFQTLKNFHIRRNDIEGTIDTLNEDVHIYEDKLTKAIEKDKRFKNTIPADIKELLSKLLSQGYSELSLAIKRQKSADMLGLNDIQATFDRNIIDKFNSRAFTLYQLIEEDKTSNNSYLNVILQQYKYLKRKMFCSYFRIKDVRTLLNDYKNFKLEQIVNLFKVIKYFEKYKDNTIYSVEPIPSWDVFNSLKEAKYEDYKEDYTIGYTISQRKNRNEQLEQLGKQEEKIIQYNLEQMVNSIYICTRLENMKNRQPEDDRAIIEYKNKIAEFLREVRNYFDLIKTFFDSGNHDRYYSVLLTYNTILEYSEVSKLINGEN